MGSGAFAVSANATVIGAYSSVAANADNSVSIRVLIPFEQGQCDVHWLLR